MEKAIQEQGRIHYMLQPGKPTSALLWTTQKWESYVGDIQYLISIHFLDFKFICSCKMVLTGAKRRE